MGDAPLSFLLDTNLGLSAEDSPVREVLAAAGITTEESVDLVAIDAKMDRHEPDIAFIPSADYLRMLIRGDRTYQGLVIGASKFTGQPRLPAVLVVRHDDPAEGLDDLAGATLGYINRSCSSSYFGPAVVVGRQGKRIDDVFDLKPVKPGPTWQGLVDAVVAGEVRAAMVLEDTWRATPANAEATRIIGGYANGVAGIIVVREDLDAGLRADLLDALLRWTPPWEGKVYGAFKPYLYADVHAFRHDLEGLPEGV